MRSLFPNNKKSDDYWISISDMMSGLMMVFLFISVSYMLKVIKEKDTIREVAVTYNRLQNDLYTDLYMAFKDSLPKWDAEIDRISLSVRFNSPEVLFKQGSSFIEPHFQSILQGFFPKYISILKSDKYKEDIEEIRIEGHTSSDWAFNAPPEVAYIFNMELSQDRTRSVLNFVLSLPDIKRDRVWIQKNLTANGLSSSKLVLNQNAIENPERSRRVEFRVKTNAEKRIVKIISESEN